MRATILFAIAAGLLKNNLIPAAEQAELMRQASGSSKVSSFMLAQRAPPLKSCEKDAVKKSRRLEKKHRQIASSCNGPRIPALPPEKKEKPGGPGPARTRVLIHRLRGHPVHPAVEVGAPPGAVLPDLLGRGPRSSA